MESELNYNTCMFNDKPIENPRYRCGWCLEDSKEDIHFDHTINGNICLSCLEDEDHQSMLSMNNYEYYNYKNKVLKSNPIEL